MNKNVFIKSTLSAVVFSLTVGTAIMPLNVKGSDTKNLSSEKPIAGLDLSMDKLISAGGTELYAYEMENIIENSTTVNQESDEESGEEKLDEILEEDTDEEDTSTEDTSTEEEEVEPEEPKSILEDVGVSTASNYVNIRAEGNTDSEILGKLYKGCAATILEYDGDWVKIKSGKVRGYIKKEYLAIGFDAEELVDKYGTKIAVVNTTTLNVRAERNTECKIITQIPVGEEYQIIKEYDEWVKIAIDDDLSGYVAKDYVDINVEFEEAISIEEELAEKKRAEEAKKAQEEQERKLKEQQEAEKKRQEEEAKKQQQSNKNNSNKNNSNKNNSNKNNSNKNDSNKNNKPNKVEKPVYSGSATGSQVANYAQKFVGNPYVYGGTSLTRGTDCSGFTQSIYKSFGISIPRDSRSQSRYGKSVSISDLRPGDLIFYTKSGRVNHVAMYIGNGKVCHASNRRDGIKISVYNYRTPYCARRIIY